MFYEILSPKIFITIAIITSVSLFVMTFKYMLQKKYPIILNILLILIAIGSSITGFKKYIEVYSLDLKSYLPHINLVIWGIGGAIIILIFISSYKYGNDKSRMFAFLMLISIIVLIILVYVLKFFAG